MKRSYQTVYILVALNATAALAFLSLMPDQVPGHFGMNGLSSRMGSKYESLFIPAIAVVFGLSMIQAAKRCDEQERKTITKMNTILQLGVMAFIA